MTEQQKTPIPERKLAPVKKQRIRLIIIVVVGMGLVGHLAYTGMKDSMAYYLTISELTEQQSKLAEQGVRIGGRVREGSLIWDPKTLQLEFVVEDGDMTLPVVYQGVIPDTFKQGTKVIVEGVYADGILKATQIMPTCPSKYEAE